MRGVSFNDEARFQRMLWTPLQLNSVLNGISAWYDAADLSNIERIGGGNRVSGWGDKGGKNNHASQETASLRPVYTFDGWRPGIIGFDAVSDLRYTLPGNTPGIGATFAVFRLTTTGGNHSLFSSSSWDAILFGGTSYINLYRQESDRLSGSYGFLTTAISMISIESQNVARNYNVRRNGALVASSTAAFNGGLTPNRIGGGAGNKISTTFVHEVIHLGFYPPDHVRWRIEGYLANKWGVPLPSSHLYVNRPPLISV
jgi:hypothetical protein